MLAGILPGLREIRAPLAAGYLWLLFAWLIAGDDVSNAGGVVGRLVDLSGGLTDAAIAVAASFAAYLIGSLSEDLFRGSILRLVREAGPSARALRARELLGGREDRLLRRLENMSPAVIEGEIAKLENRTGRLDAESSLRVAILPPLLAIYLYLVVVDSWWWIFAGVFLPSLLIQAFLRTRDYEVARRALWELRRRFGLPPRSVGEEGEAEASLGSG